MDTNFPTLSWTIPANEMRPLRETLQASAAQSRVTEEQRSLIREICSAVQVRTVAPEQFFAAFKRALNITAQDLGIQLNSHRDDTIARLMTACIEEFYDASVSVNNRPSHHRTSEPMVPRLVIRSSVQPGDDNWRALR